ncbi:hypothetical protein ANN_14244 [Periplaneta americana]|uniref:Uncharacterized protein n=1 Tax=Periplaneta americana TaxID=6978 RepID=A0ABQ8SX74_PERAM|nr:hypothetical protein ANN_14244 [Periplaneta americana]
MAGLCEGGNEPPGSLKAKDKKPTPFTPWDNQKGLLFTVDCPKTGLNITSDTNKASFMTQLSQEIMG